MNIDELVVIMVVEDDQLIQGMVSDALSEGGFEAAVAQSGEEAITLLQDQRTHYRALIADINLCGSQDGWEVAKSARGLNPDIPVIYMTGAAADDWASRGVPNSLLLNKPFAPAQIVTAIAQLLNAAVRSARGLRPAVARGILRRRLPVVRRAFRTDDEFGLAARPDLLLHTETWFARSAIWRALCRQGNVRCHVACHRRRVLPTALGCAA
jgi:CheY-like chemotaxis protein